LAWEGVGTCAKIYGALTLDLVFVHRIFLHTQKIKENKKKKNGQKENKKIFYFFLFFFIF
jgi:hypothetical protein